MMSWKRRRKIIDEAELDFEQPPAMPSDIPLPLPKPMTLDAATGRTQLSDRIGCKEIHVDELTVRKISNGDFHFMKSEVLLQRVLLFLMVLTQIGYMWFDQQEKNDKSTVPKVQVLQRADDQGD